MDFTGGVIGALKGASSLNKFEAWFEYWWWTKSLHDFVYFVLLLLLIFFFLKGAIEIIEKYLE